MLHIVTSALVLLLQIVVRSAVIITLMVLATAFGALFLHNWRLFEQPKPVKPANKMSADDSDEDEDFYEEMDPMLKRKLLQTRRKSVAFSVCVVDKENMTFDLDRKRVLLGLASSTDRIPLSSACALPTLEESCETEKMGQHIPLVMSTKPEYGTSKQEYNRVRRMSVPAVPLAREFGERVGRNKGLLAENKFCNSIETII